MGRERRDAEGAEASGHDPLTERVIGAALEVHRELGPGLLESVYRHCLAEELLTGGLVVRREVPVPVRYKGTLVATALRIDLIVNNAVVVEVKAVAELSGVHRAQLLTYLRLANLRRGLLINFDVPNLRRGIRRVVNGWPGKATDAR